MIGKRRAKQRKEPNARAALDTSVFDRVLHRRDAGLRCKLAQQLAEFVASGEASVAERAAVLPYLLRLAGDRHEAVRRTLAERLRDARDLEADLVFSIVADKDDIALPFLERARALDCKRQLAIFRAGDVRRRKALASRADVCADLSDLISREGEAAVAEVLLDNAAAEIGADALKRLYVRFRDVPAIVDRLLAREDLPPEVRVAHVRLASHRLRAAMRRGELCGGAALRKAVRESEERALADILCRVADDETQLKATLRFMMGKEMLTPAVVFRAACRGRVRVLAHTVALLCGTTARRVEKAAGMSGPFGLKGLWRRSGLPANGLALARALFEAAADGHAGLARPAFAREVLSRIVARGDELSVAEKAELAEMLAEFTDGETRHLAERLSNDLKRAA